MLVVLDTSSLIRFFTNDEAGKAQKVKNLLKNEKMQFIYSTADALQRNYP